jgi:pSer/pThr/pTyr-binding forkhead associated (FHA) protein
MILKMRVIQGKPAGKTLLFRPGGDYLFGRGDECHVRFNSEWVSRQHCLVRVREVGAILCDLGSRNGTLINGLVCEGEQELNEGDQVQIGPLTFVVALEPSPAEAAPEVPEPLHSEDEAKRSPLEGTAQQPALRSDEMPPDADETER